MGSGLTILGGNVEIKGTTISQNGVADQEEGGGMAIGGGATVIIADSRISDHHARSGGGLLIVTSDVTIVNSAIYDNEVLIHGGGLSICSTGAKLVNVTISGNDADEDGGGIYVCPTGAVSLANVTISDNEADRNADDGGNGGGLYLHTSGNDTGMAYLRNTIVAGNADLSPSRTAVRAPDCFGSVESQGYNLIGALGSSPSGYPCFIAGNTAGTTIGEGAELDVLADNGGPTLTHALLPTSLAINRGNPAGCRDFDNNLLAADQRHAMRIDRCDLGAYEFGGLVERLFLPAIRKP